MFQKEPQRGPRIEYDVMNDQEIKDLNIEKILKNTLVFVWTFKSKREVAIEFMKNNNISFVDRLIWVNMTKNNEIISSLVTLCGEEPNLEEIMT